MRLEAGPTGWPPALASALARPIDYANLAIRGRLLEPIVHDQLGEALRLNPKPTLLSLNGGGNDMMRPGTDLDRLIELTLEAVQRCAEADVPLLLLSGADPSARLPFGRTIHQRGKQLTAALTELVAGRRLTFVDAFNDPKLRRAEYWSADRLHLAPAGHARVAALVLAALGHPGATEAPLASPPRGVLTKPATTSSTSSPGSPGACGAAHPATGGNRSIGTGCRSSRPEPACWTA